MAVASRSWTPVSRKGRGAQRPAKQRNTLSRVFSLHRLPPLSTDLDEFQPCLCRERSICLTLLGLIDGFWWLSLRQSSTGSCQSGSLSISLPLPASLSHTHRHIRKHKKIGSRPHTTHLYLLLNLHDPSCSQACLPGPGLLRVERDGGPADRVQGRRRVAARSPPGRRRRWPPQAGEVRVRSATRRLCVRPLGRLDRGFRAFSATKLGIVESVKGVTYARETRRPFQAFAGSASSLLRLILAWGLHRQSNHEERL